MLMGAVLQMRLPGDSTVTVAVAVAVAGASGVVGQPGADVGRGRVATCGIDSRRRPYSRRSARLARPGR
jgi:hypothetical protein